MSLASWLEGEYDRQTVRRAFDAMTQAQRTDFESQNAPLIEELIRRPENQRRAVIRRAYKNVDETTRGLLIVFAAICQARMRCLIELPDGYRDVLMPGSGNRVTCASLYGFQTAVVELYEHAWPWEVFSTYGGGGDGHPGDEDEDDADG
ncbi:MAG: hypothetical protein CBARDMAM_0945 [uncultured Caballeronia sp.]|nr:MAG: hypothetical protein CBARDMAM_0945 [uncultured Caballeronia sp.]